jgi:glycerophosphoryl diester phosphodiesterase
VSSSTSSEQADSNAPVTQPAARTKPSRGFYAIAHRAGNNLHQLEEALDAGIDAIECDFWHARGRLALRHERKLPGLPVIFDKWYLRFALGELSLRRLLAAISFRAELFLDIKSRTPRAADAVLDLYHDNASMMPHTLVCSYQWKLLDRIAEAKTDMELFYSIGSAGGVDALIKGMDRTHRPAGTSIRHTVLSADVVARLHAEGLQVFAWTVNTRHRAEELISWGIDGLISDDLEVLRLGEEITAAGG